jgi:hypothetical protein
LTSDRGGSRALRLLRQRIVAACEDVANIYDAVTFVLQQSLHIPETVTKIQGSPEGSTLFFAHLHSITMWDVQTGGLTHTFTVDPRSTISQSPRRGTTLRVARPMAPSHSGIPTRKRRAKVSEWPTSCSHPLVVALETCGCDSGNGLHSRHW